MSGGGTPKDNSLELERMKQAEEAAARQRELDAAKVANQQWWTQRKSAVNNARNAATSYFTSKGVDAAPYMDAINKMITSKASSLSNPSGLTPGSPIGETFNGIGEAVYTDAQGNERLKANNELTQGEFAPFPSGYDMNRLPSTYDDSILSTINNEQRTAADNFINAMVQRGVITDSGAAAARTALDRQSPGAQSRLTTQGDLALEGGRAELRGVGGRAATAAGELPVGTKFNTDSWRNQLESTFSNFINGLDANIRGKIGNASLYDTSGLASIAGAAQGAGPGVQPSSSGLPFSTTDDEDKKLANRTGANTGLGI